MSSLSTIIVFSSGVIAWIAFLFLTFFIPPQTAWILLVWFICLFDGLGVVGIVVFRSYRRGILLGGGVVTFLFLKMYGMDSYLNIGLLLLIILGIEFFFLTR